MSYLTGEILQRHLNRLSGNKTRMFKGWALSLLKRMMNTAASKANLRVLSCIFVGAPVASAK